MRTPARVALLSVMLPLSTMMLRLTGTLCRFTLRLHRERPT